MNTKSIIERHGGPVVVGRLCRVTRQAVSQWTRIPARFVLRLAQQGELTPHDMRPDLYPHPLDGKRRKTNGKRR